MSTRLRTAEEIFQAGWDEGADDPPLTQQEIERLVALHGPHLRPEAKAS